MQIVDVDINELKPAEYNPRGLSAKEKKDLLESLETFGMVEPIVANSAPERMNVIIGGHQRYFLEKERGSKTIPTVYINLPDIIKEQELNLRLNKNNGHWEWDLLANFEEEMLKQVGFASEELDKIFKGGKDDGDENKELQEGEIKSKLGEVYQLGRHRLICGDSTDPEVLKKLFDGKKARLIYTDPPYNVGYDYTVTQVDGRTRNTPFETFNDSRTPVDFVKFLETVFANASEYLQEAGCFYCWHASQTAHLFREALLNAKYHISQTLVWLKDRPTFSRGLDYLWVIEPVFFGWKKGGKHYYNKLYNLQFENVLGLSSAEFPNYIDVLYQKRDSVEEYVHPTQKPISLGIIPITRHSQRDDIVLDMFGGSGSTLLACHQLERICYMVELDPKFVDAIRRRYVKFTGGKEDEWEALTPIAQ